MQPARKRRLYFICVLVFGVAMAATLILFALQRTINLYYTPTQVRAGMVPSHAMFRMGGWVENGSISRLPNDPLSIRFAVTDHQQMVWVQYRGVLPDLFREGQGVVVQGRLNPQEILTADQVLAKHDENYFPKSIKNMIKGEA